MIGPRHLIVRGAAALLLAGMATAAIAATSERVPRIGLAGDDLDACLSVGQVTGRIRFGERKPAGLRQNQQLTTRILMDEHADVLIVERGPFIDTGAGRVAYVVRDGTAERTTIQIGATSLNAVEIVSGVKEGDRIVISGTDQFNGAQRVALN